MQFADAPGTHCQFGAAQRNVTLLLPGFLHTHAVITRLVRVIQSHKCRFFRVMLDAPDKPGHDKWGVQAHQRDQQGSVLSNSL